MIWVKHSLLTLKDTLASQKDLGQLCADRPLQTNEMFSPNSYYGNDYVLKKYANLSQTYRLKAIMPHGFTPSEDFIWAAEAKSPLPVVLCWQPHREHVYISQTDKFVLRSAAPFLYIVEMLKEQPQPERKGTIFFPVHSTHYVTAQMDFEATAERLTQLGDEYKPITVCIYWRDFNLGHHLPFEKRGLPIVSAGHMYDTAFLFRFYHLCSMHRYAASNELGSQLFYSVKSGCSYFYFDKLKTILVADDHILRRDTATVSSGIEVALKSLFNTPRPFITTEQMSRVDYYLGTDYLRSPKELRSQLLHAEMLDKFGFLVYNRGKKARFVIPSYYRRVSMSQVAKLSIVKCKLSRLWRRPV